MNTSSIRNTLLIAGLVLVASCQHLTGPKLTPRYYISPDTLTGSIGQAYGFSIHSSDSTWHAYKYLWDLGDGHQPQSIISSDSITISYSTQGVYHVTAIAMDSLDNVIAKANAIAVIGLPQERMVLTPHTLNDSSTDPILFQAMVTPSLSLEYHWNFGDGSSMTNTYQEDTVSHRFYQSGTYHVVATAYYQGYPVCSDTAVINVAFPSIRMSALTSMSMVTSRIEFSTGGSFEYTLPLRNVGENSFTVNGGTISAEFLHHGLDSNSVRKFDTIYSRITSGTLSESGSWLTLTNSSYEDYRISDSSHPDQCLGIDHNISEYLMLYHFPTDSIFLTHVSSDSIVFSSEYGRTYDAGFDSVTDHYAYNSSLPDLGRFSYSAPRRGTVSITFWRK